MSTSAARPASESISHWYSSDGKAMHTVIAKGSGLPRQTTLADARKLGLLPSVSGILRVLDKPALNTWKVEQALLAAMTTPMRNDETVDTFVKRVLSVDAEQEGQKARDFGTLIHSQLEWALSGKTGTDSDTEPFCRPVLELVGSLGKPIATERIVVGNGYAGTLDCIVDTGCYLTVLDFKTSKAARLPEKSYIEHRLALSAYAGAYSLMNERPNRPITTANIYISSVTPGLVTLCNNGDWEETFEQGFKPILNYWRWANSYTP